jgi:hypothetical protein
VTTTNATVFEHARRRTVPIPWRADRDEVHFGNDELSVRADAGVLASSRKGGR